MFGLDLESPPAWAYSWCYYFLILGLLPLFASVVVVLFMGKKLGFTISTLYLLSAIIQGATGLTLFYMCRASLKPVQKL